MANRVTLTAILAMSLAACASTPMSADHPPGDVPRFDPNGPRPYVFTQVHRDLLPWWKGGWRPQRVASGAHVQVQLPGEPTIWSLAAGECAPSPCEDCGRLGAGAIAFDGLEIIPSPNRITGTRSIFQFDFRVSGEGLVAICVEADPPTVAHQSEGSKLGSARLFKLTLEVEPEE